MQERLVEIIQQELTKLSGVDCPPLTPVSIEELPQEAERWCIVLGLTGHTQGFLAITIAPELARELSLRIIQKALDGNFDPAMLEDELTKNTIGEFGNIVLGEFFRNEKHEKSTYIAAPRYATLKQERELVQTAEEHFRLDVLGNVCFLSWRMRIK